jgi:hypothetical protein
MEAGGVSFTTVLSEFESIYRHGREETFTYAENNIENCSVGKAPKIHQHRGGDVQNANFFQTGFHSSERSQYSARDLK